MKVEVTLYAWQSRTTGSSGESPFVLHETLEEGATFDVLLAGLLRKYPELKDALLDTAAGALYDYVGVILNGRFLDTSQGATTPLHEGDRVQLLPFLAGG